MKSIKNKLKYIYVLASSEFSHVIADNLKCLPGLESVSPLCQPHPDSSVDLNISVCPLKNSIGIYKYDFIEETSLSRYALFINHIHVYTD